jgi:putative colanic acid biosysnthesis UDP-glucose lipid carrier transferase
MHYTYTNHLITEETHQPLFSLYKKIYARKDPKYLFIKRLFDCTIALLVLVFLLSWLLPVMALLIKLDSKGPVFFKQKRVGYNGNIFNCLKLRSMVVNKDADKKQATDNDPRITNLGKFLRVSCIDELPQFFNVLVGDMSIVGPRPHMISDCKAFSQQIDGYNFRHLMKPGITGMSQVKGYRGETSSFYDVFHRYQWDAFYVRNANILLDIKIIKRTFIQTFMAIKNMLTKKEEKIYTSKVIPINYLKSN